MNLKKLTIEDLAEIRDFTNRFEPYSDFNVISLWAWNTGNNTEFQFHNGNLIIKMPDYREPDSSVMSVLGENNTEKTLDVLYEHANVLEIDSLSFVPEITIQNIKSNKFNITKDFDDFDYIYEVKNFISPKGNNLKSFRKKINKFTKDLDSVKVKELNLANRKTQTEILDLFRKLQKTQVDEENDTENEYAATSRLLKYQKYFDLISLGVYHENKLIAYTISQNLNNGFSMGHFGKYEYKIDGIFQYLERENAIMSQKHRIKYLNLQQDLGLPKLRASKKSLRPTKMLMKFNVEFK